MELIDSKAISTELLCLEILDKASYAGHSWPQDGEVTMVEDLGQYFLSHADAIVPVRFRDPGILQRMRVGEWHWCLVDVGVDAPKLRAVEASASIELDLQIGIDDRILDQMRSRDYISTDDYHAAATWLGEEFLFESPRYPGALNLVSIGNRNATQSTLTLVGRRHHADLREHDGSWRLTRLAPARGGSHALTILHGQLAFVEAGSAAQLRSPAQRQQLRDHIDAHGDYIELWHRYATLEWRRATVAARELGVLRYTKRHATGDEQLDWSYTVNPEQAQHFIKQWRTLARNNPQQNRALEACATPPGWMSGDDTNATAADGRPVIGTEPQLDGDQLTLSYDSDRSNDKPPPQGLLCLSVHGERKVQQRRDQALERVRNATNPMPQLHALLEGQPVPLRESWRKQRALSPHARQAFAGQPTRQQEKALKLALNTSDITVIIGPPGTGKTQVISALQRRLAEQFPDPNSLQHQLLVTSFQHDAVDNALARIQVFGLPAAKIGRRHSSKADAGSDPVRKWRMGYINDLRKRLESGIACEPVFAALQGLREQAIRLRIQSLGVDERRQLSIEFDHALHTLEQQHGVTADAHSQQQWRDWIALQLEKQPAAISLERPEQILWRRALRTLRVTTDAFADDGPQRCGQLLAVHQQLGIALPDDDHRLLDALVQNDSPAAEQIEQLSALRERLLTRSRPDYRPPQLRRILDQAGCQALEAMISSLEQRLSTDSRWSRLAILRAYLDEIEHRPARIEQAIEAYSTTLGATCQQSAAEPMRGVLGLDPDAGISFDTVVIDEAARATPLDLLIPMAMARKRIILVGDHRQLPHLLDPKTEQELEQSGTLRDAERKALGESLFERMVIGLRKLHRDHPEQPVRVITLDTQFRMHPVLGDFVSRTFYEAVDEPPIKSGRPAEEFSHPVPGLQGRVAAWIDLPVRDAADREARRSGSRIREVEAQRIAKEAQCILQACPDISVGVITFYAAQRDRILNAMLALDLTERHEGSGPRICQQWATDERGNERLRVGTVDAFQGKEFDVVLLSIVRTNAALRGDDPDLALTRKYGFLRLSNRLNVAMSRQKRLLVVVGDAALARAAETSEAAPGLAEFYRLCQGEYGHVS